jgi:tRNA(fMet)-specific endonuclease VapC
MEEAREQASIGMLVVLDTNHFRELQENSTAGKRLIERIESAHADVFTCIVAVEETVQGWLSLLKRKAPGKDQVQIYTRLQRDLTTLIKLVILPFDDEAAEAFQKQRRLRPQMGTMDLKIAAICLAHDALLLTRNLADFKDIVELQVANWLD